MKKATLEGLFSATMAFLKANWLAMIAMIVGVCVVSGVLGYLMLGSFFSMAMAGGTPDPTVILAMMGQFALVYLIVMVLLYAASLSIWRHGMTNGQDGIAQNIGWALLGGLTLMLLYIGLFIALYIAMIVVVLILVAIVGGGIGAFGQGGFSPQNVAGPAIAFVVVLYLAFIVAMLWVAARLSIIGPVMAAQRTVNPITGLAQSWSLTKASQWTLVGFFVLVAIASTVALLVLVLVLGPLQIPALVLLPYVPLWLFWWAVPPGIYAQVAAPDRGPVFQ